MKIHIVDYDSGNLESIRNALKKVGCDPVTTNKASELINANAVIFPGQGSFPSAMDKLSQFDITKTLIKLIKDGVPFLGICLGLQLMFESSEEGNIEGLNLLKGTVPKISDSVKVPHIGWNSVKFGKSHKIFEGIPDDSYFYFLHSYYFNCKKTDSVIGVTKYHKKFHTIINHNNIFGVQFHPEKSQKAGEILINNFLTI